MSGGEKELGLPPGRFMEGMRTLLAIYGRPLEREGVDTTASRPTDIAEPHNRNSVHSDTSVGSEAGLSRSFKEPVGDQKLEDILVRWEQGGEALFRDMDESEEEDAMCPGKTYPVRIEIESGGESSGGGEHGVAEDLRKKRYRRPSVETVTDDGVP
jgi:hypothetical protein